MRRSTWRLMKRSLRPPPNAVALCCTFTTGKNPAPLLATASTTRRLLASPHCDRSSAASPAAVWCRMERTGLTALHFRRRMSGRNSRPAPATNDCTRGCVMRLPRWELKLRLLKIVAARSPANVFTATNCTTCCGVAKKSPAPPNAATARASSSKARFNLNAIGTKRRGWLRCRLCQKMSGCR